MAHPTRINPRKLPQQERARATIDAILTATARILVKEGFDRASTNRIAEEAGVSVGSLYQYFPGKEALVAALIERHLDEMTSLFASAFVRFGELPLRVISAEDIQHWKPLWDVYLHSADVLGVDPSELALVSTHGWDIEGAHQAALTTAWIPRSEPQLSAVATPPDITAASLVEAVERLLALPRGPQLRRPSETLH